MVKISFLVPELGCSSCTSFADHCFNARFAGQDLVTSHQFRGASGARPGLSCQVMVVSKDVRYWYFWVKAVMKYSLLMFTGIMSAQYAQNKYMSKYHGREKSKNRTAKIRAMSFVGSRWHSHRFHLLFSPRNRVANANFHKLSAVTTTSSWRTRFQVHEGPSQ